MLSNKAEEASEMPVVIGIDFHHSDGTHLPPKTKELERLDAEEWFFSSPNLIDGVNFRILSSQANGPFKSFRPPFSSKVVEHAIWGPEVYYNLTSNRSGGAAGFADDPPRFIMQTPMDDGPFCSLAMSKKGTLVKGVFSHSDDVFEPATIATGEQSLSSWRQSGLQIITLPQALLRRHSQYVSGQLAELMEQMDNVEHAIEHTEPTSFAPLSKKLHTCHSSLLKLERRSRFEASLIAAIEEIASKSRHGQIPWPAVAPQKSALEARAFDFESLPRRIDNARNTISGLIQQRNERMNLEIAESSRRMTEIALSDNASMKTIAIMTMIFLPGTAVASFFSMNMLNWSANNGESIASKWLWVYFVVAVPLTVAVVMLWWIWARRMQNRLLRISWIHAQSPQANFEDIELQQQEQIISPTK